jgi:hypothetical protein
VLLARRRFCATADQRHTLCCSRFPLSTAPVQSPLELCFIQTACGLAETLSWCSDDIHRTMATHLLAHHDIRPTLATPPPTGPPIPIITRMWNDCGVTASTISSAIEGVAPDDTWELRSHERPSWLLSGHLWLPYSLNSQTLSHGEYAGQLLLDVIMLLPVIRMALLVYLSYVTLLRWSRMSATS